MFRLAIAIIGLPLHAIAILCNAGWQQWNQACYNISHELVPLSKASSKCKQHGAELASIHSYQENQFIRSLGGNKDIFIGLSYSNIEGTYTWSDGSALAYTNWADNEPADYLHGIRNDCVILAGANGKWSSTPCIMWYGYVCKLALTRSYREEADNISMKKKQSFTVHEKKALAHHVIHRKQVSSLIHCALVCVNKPSCKSINFIPEPDSDEGECELSDATAKDSPQDFKKSANSFHCDPSDLL